MKQELREKIKEILQKNISSIRSYSLNGGDFISMKSGSIFVEIHRHQTSNLHYLYRLKSQIGDSKWEFHDKDIGDIWNFAFLLSKTHSDKNQDREEDSLMKALNQFL